VRAVDGFTVAKAAGAGLALAAVNPKNALLAIAAAAEIVEGGLATGEQVAVLLTFVLVASAGVIAPVALTLVLGERARAPLERLRGWMARHNATIMAVLFLLIGAIVGDAVAGLAA